jgi:GNAT superfamily N-acetyltransferase
VNTERFAIDHDRASTQESVLFAFLLQEAYWARWRSEDDIRAQLDAAWRVVNVIDTITGVQVGFARVTSDGISMAYLADLFVHPDFRGQGIGKAIMAAVLSLGPDFRWMLHTNDAHGLYRQFGFAPPDFRYLERAEVR